MDTIDASLVAWIFMSIHFWDKDHVTREDILHSAEAINFAIPDGEELDTALRHLLKRGLIEQLEGAISISESGLAFARSTDRGPSKLYETLQELKSHFGMGTAV